MDWLRHHVHVDHVTKHHKHPNGHVTALHEVTFDVYKGEFVSIVGPSGCGKSTLLRILAGLDSPSSGTVLLNGHVGASHESKMSMVFQSFALFPWRTVQNNVEYGLEMRGLPRAERRSISQGLLDLVGLAGYEHMYPKQLSGGMKQRVGIARALAIDPEVVLMDEAFSALDEFTAETLREQVSEIHQRTGKTFILVTHNLHEAIVLADRIIVMSRRPGRVKKILAVEMARPRERRHSTFGKIHSHLFSLLKEELESTMIHPSPSSVTTYESAREMKVSPRISL